MLVYAAFRACPADASAKLGLPPSGLPASPSTRPAQRSRLNKDLVQASAALPTPQSVPASSLQMHTVGW